MYIQCHDVQPTWNGRGRGHSFSQDVSPPKRKGPQLVTPYLELCLDEGHGAHRLDTGFNTDDSPDAPHQWTGHSSSHRIEATVPKLTVRVN